MASQWEIYQLHHYFLRRNEEPNFIVYLGLPKVGYAVISLVFGTSGWSPAKVTPLPEAGESFTLHYLGMSSSDFKFKGNKGYVFLNLKMRLKLLKFCRSVFDLCLLLSLPN